MDQSSVPAPYDAELPLRRPAYRAEASTASIPEVSSAEEHDGRVDIRVDLVPAVHAAELLSNSIRGVHHAAGRTGLTGVRGRDLDECAARRLQFVAEHVDEHRPSGTSDLATEPTAHHAPHIQPLDDHHAVALGVASREHMEDVRTLATDLAVKLRDPEAGAGAPPRALPTPSDDALGMGEATETRLQMLGIGHEDSIRIGQQVRQPPIDGDHGRGARLRLGHLLLTLDRHDPLVHLASDRATLRSPHHRPMEDGLDLAELREDHAGRHHAEHG